MKKGFLKGITMLMSVVMIGITAVGCAESEKTYTEEDIATMNDEEFEEFVESKISKLEEEEELPDSKESDGIDIWKDVEVTYDGVNRYSFVNIEYIGDNQTIKENVQFYPQFNNVETEDPSFIVWCPSTGEKFWVAAVYDEQAMEDAGIKIKKYADTDRNAKDRMTSSLSGTFEGAVDIYPFVVPELPGKYIQVTDETDMTIFNDAVAALTERAKAAELTEDESWIKNESVYPKWGAVQMDMDAAKLSVAYFNEENVFVGQCSASVCNAFYENGEWCKEIWEAIPDDYVNLIVSPGTKFKPYNNYEEWEDHNYNSKCFEIE